VNDEHAVVVCADAGRSQRRHYTLIQLHPHNEMSGLTTMEDKEMSGWVYRCKPACMVYVAVHYFNQIIKPINALW
jgi:hypothetical protein